MFLQNYIPKIEISEVDTKMEAPLLHINCRNLTLESADKLTNMSSHTQGTRYFIQYFFADDSCIKSFHMFMLPYITLNRIYCVLPIKSLYETTIGA